MEDVTTEEGWLTTPDSQKLYTKTWKPPSRPHARLVFLHGFSDHCNFYGVLFPTLAQKGVKVYSFDQRGWGRSVHETRQRGLTGPTSQIMADITAFIKQLPEDEEDVPLFLMGHSMGGGETLFYASTGPKEIVSKIRGFLLESPLIALAPSVAPSKALLVMGKLAARVMPHRPLVRKLPPETMSRDPDVVKEWIADTLCHDTGTLECLDAMTNRSGDLDQGRVVLKDDLGDGGKTRVWIGHGTVDGACDYDAARRWFDRIPVEDKEFRVYEGWYHKLHAEPGNDKFTFANDVAKWILDRSDSPSEAKGEAPKSKL